MLPLRIARPARARLLSALMLAALASGCTGNGGAGPGQVAQLQFAEKIRVVPARGQAPASAEQEARSIVQTFTAWYQGAFVDPAGWDDPKFPDVVRLFTGDAGERVRTELDSVTIGASRKELRSVTPGPSTIAVTLYVDSDGAPSYAIADVSFQASGTLKQAGPPLRIVQKGVYYLRRGQGGAWKVFSYQARADQAQAPPAPPAGGSS
ncbi:MAG: hypothetical protein ACRDJM_06270 [Actinomycetota bacterium]